MKPSLIIVIVLVIISSCTQKHKGSLNFPVNNLDPKNITIKRYGKALFELDTTQLQQALIGIQPDFYHFLDANLYDSSNILKIHNFVTDTQLRKLYQRSLQIFPALTQTETDLTQAFRRFHYHLPMNIIPEIYTYISGVQFEAPVLTDEKVVVVALDCYFGNDEVIYKRMGIPNYITERMTPEHLVNDVFKSLYSVQIAKENQSLTILDEMIKAGKLYYFLEAMQPDIADNILFGISENQLKWLKKHEGDVWAMLISQQVLYASDFQLFRKLFGDGPFSQDFSPEAPARIGEWVGWQIIRHYMDNKPETSLSDLIILSNSQDILAGSHYKPRK